MKHPLDSYLDAYRKIFAETSNKYEAHLKAHVYLNRMANDDEVIFEIFRRSMVLPSFFKQPTSSPDFLISLIDTPECSLSMSFFGPLPDRRTDYTYSTLHHHDDFILSTISAKGPGYSSFIFKQGYEINRESGEVKLELEKYTQHEHLRIEFIDKHTAHTIFYPSDISMTYALWSSHKPTSAISSWKNASIVKKNKSLIKGIAKKFTPNLKAIGIAQYREDYFYPDNGRLMLLPGQIQPPIGNQFVQNLFNKLQYVGFNDRKFLENLIPVLSPDDRKLIEPWIKKFLNGESIPINYDSYVMITPRRNVPMEDFRKIFSF